MAKKSPSVSKAIKPKSKKTARGNKLVKPARGSQSVEQQLAQLEAMLQIINSIQQGLAAKLDFQSIVDLVGDKLREVFNTPDLSIRWYDEKNNLVHYLYSFEHGKRLNINPESPDNRPIWKKIAKTRQPVVWNNSAEGDAISPSLPGTDDSKSGIYIPIISSNHVLGVIGTENYEHENAYGKSELRLLTTIAASLGTALENARLFDETQRLLKITEDRAAELAIINSVQAALAAELNIQGIYDAIGDKIREIFHNKDIGIRIYDPQTGLLHFPYVYENGERIRIDSLALSDKGFTAHVFRTRETVLINENMAQEMEKYGAYTLPGTQVEKSAIFVPLVAGDQIRGLIDISDYKREYAFSESDVRLLTTLANSMSVALENARLFDETQRLLKETEQRNAELAIINSVQATLATKLDTQGIYDAVGEKIRDIFDAQVLTIVSLDLAAGTGTYHYMIENKERMYPEPYVYGGIAKELINTRQMVLLNRSVPARLEELGVMLVPGTAMPKASLYVPLIVGNQTTGIISLQNLDRENAFQESDVRLLTTLASSMSVALENARLFDETQRLLKETEQRAAELAIINSVGESMSRLLDVQTITRTVGDKVTEIFRADATAILMLDAKNNMIQPVFELDEGIYLENVESFPLGTGLTSQVIQSRQPLILGTAESAAALGAYYPPEAAEINPTITQSYLGVPIILGEKVIGVVSAHTYTKHAYDQNSVRLLSTLASNMGVALENARLFDETQRLLKETEERNAELAILNTVGEAMAKALDVKSVTRNVGDKVREIFNAEIVDILMFDAKTRFVQLAYSYYGKYFDNEPPWELGEGGLTSKIITTRQPLLLSTTQEINENGAQAYITAESDEEDPQSYMGVPIMIGEKVLGVVDVQSLRPKAFDENSLRLLQTLSSNMGIALENARLFDETQRLLKETEQRNAELAIINSISQALTQELDLRSLVDLVGDKLREAIRTENIGIGLYNKNANLLTSVYVYKNGERVHPESAPLNAYSLRLARQGKSLVLNDVTDEIWKKLGSNLTFGRDVPKSVIMIPILAGGELIGGITVQNFKNQNAYPDSMVRLMEMIAPNMGTAIQNARLFEETQRLLKETEKRAQELSAISTVSQALVAESELENMIHLIGSQMREIFDADIVYIALLDSQAGTIHFPYQYGDNFPTLKLGEGLTSKIIQTGEPLLINKDIEERVKEIGTTRIGKESLSYLGVPIKAGRDTIGVISVQSITREGVFNDDSLRLLTTIAANAGSAFHTAQLHAETQRRAREMATLAEVGRDISSSLEASTVLEGIATHAKELLQGNLSALFLPEEDGKTFRAIAAVGEDAVNVRNDIITLGEGILGNIAKNKIGEIINDANNDERAITIAGTENLPDEHILIVPLLANDEMKGLMAVWRTGKGLEFTEFELEFLNNLARQAVIAIQNTQLFAEAQDLRIAAEQANHAKSAFLANMSHELRTPLSAIIGFTRIVRRKAEGVLPEKQTENLDKVLSSAEHLLGLINTVLDIAKIEAGRMDVQASNFNISALADQCANLAAPLLRPTVQLEKQVDESITIVYSDQDKIKQIVLNLLSNAAKFTHEGKIILGIQKADANIHIYVTDSGIGISEEALGRVFEEFQQADTSTTRKYGGTGLGLSISRNLARLLGGDLTATSEFGKGATFTLTIPIK